MSGLPERQETATVPSHTKTSRFAQLRIGRFLSQQAKAVFLKSDQTLVTHFAQARGSSRKGQKTDCARRSRENGKPTGDLLTAEHPEKHPKRCGRHV